MNNIGMRYAGSKGKCGAMIRTIQSVIDRIAASEGFDLVPVWEPFWGMGKIGCKLSRCEILASDIDEPVITLFRKVTHGWRPPSKISEVEYKFLMGLRGTAEDRTNPLMAFVGYGCSFGARYFQGYARSKSGKVNFAKSARQALLNQLPYLKHCSFIGGDYRYVWRLIIDKSNQLLKPRVIVCDPPYAGTKPCGSTMTRFNSEKFWKWAQARAKEGIAVLVCEYTCPIPGAIVLWEQKTAAGIRFDTGGDGGAKGSGKKKLESLYCLTPSVAKQVGLGLLA